RNGGRRNLVRVQSYRLPGRGDLGSIQLYRPRTRLGIGDREALRIVTQLVDNSWGGSGAVIHLARRRDQAELHVAARPADADAEHGNPTQDVDDLLDGLAGHGGVRGAAR